MKRHKDLIGIVLQEENEPEQLNIEVFLCTVHTYRTGSNGVMENAVITGNHFPADDNLTETTWSLRSP